MLDGVSSPKRKYPTKIFTNMQRRSVRFSHLCAFSRVCMCICARFHIPPPSRTPYEPYCIVCCMRTHKGYVKSDFWPCIIQTNNFFSRPLSSLQYFTEGRGGNYSRSSIKRTQIFGWINARNSGGESEKTSAREF